METMSEVVRELSVLGLLGIYSLLDYKDRKLNTFWMKCFFLLGIGGRFFFWKAGAAEIFAAFLPGLLVMLLAKLTRGGIGTGDGALLLLAGFFLPLIWIWNMFCLAVYMAAIWGLGLLLLSKKKKEYEMPFIPFLLIGYVWQLIWR